MPVKIGNLYFPETWKPGNLETVLSGNLETVLSGNLETQENCHFLGFDSLCVQHSRCITNVI